MNLIFKTGELFLWVGIKDVMRIWYPFQNTEKLSEEIYGVWVLISARISRRARSTIIVG